LIEVSLEGLVDRVSDTINGFSAIESFLEIRELVEADAPRVFVNACEKRT
jgi:hypothetical protein